MFLCVIDEFLHLKQTTRGPWHFTGKHLFLFFLFLLFFLVFFLVVHSSCRHCGFVFPFRYNYLEVIFEFNKEL